jgi:hypothetical protein
MSAELNVELRLLANQVQGDAAKATDILRKQLATLPTDRLGKVTNGILNLNNQLRQTVDLIHKISKGLGNLGSGGSGGGGGRAVGGLPSSGGGGGSRSGVNSKQAFDMSMTNLAMPLFNPLSPWSTMWGTRNIFKGMSSEYGEKFRASKMGGMSAEAATLAVVGAATAVGLALRGLRKAVEETMASYERARQLYAKSLMSGLGLNLTVKRGLLSQILGVSEQDVLKFGGAVAYINPKIEKANAILTRTAMPLAKVGIDFEILKVKAEAMFAAIADKAAPGIERLIDALGDMFDWLSSHADQIANFFGYAKETGAQEKFRASTSFWAENPEIKKAVMSNIGIGKHQFDMQGGQFTEEQWKRFSTLSAKEASTMGKSMGLSDMQSQMFSRFVQDMKKTYSGDRENGLPAPQAFMKTLHASSWEKMGLVIGGGTKTTNDLIRQGNKYLETIAAAVGGSGRVPRGSFGLDPLVANP